MNKSILVILDTLPYPVRRNGMSVRWFPFVRGLQERGYTIDMVVINKNLENYTEKDIAGLKRICGRVDIIERIGKRRGSVPSLVRRLKNVSHLVMPFGIPYGLIDNNRDYYLEAVASLIANRPVYDIGIGIGVGGNNAELLLSLDDAIRPKQVVCDFIDSAYLLRKRARKCYRGLLNPLGWLEDVKTRGRERSLCERCKCTYITDKDAATVGPGKAHVIPNGIVADGLDVSSPVELEHPNIAFLGNMAYSPNIDACNYLLEDILPRLRKKVPGIHLYIIGRNPGKELIERCHDSNIHVTGEVDNIWDYVRSVDVFVFSLVSGAGLQNKVLEAMYAGKPVVTSQIGNGGVGAVHGRDLYIAHTSNEYVTFIGDALARPELVGCRAREYVDAHFSTHALVEKYAELLEEDRADPVEVPESGAR